MVTSDRTKFTLAAKHLARSQSADQPYGLPALGTVSPNPKGRWGDGEMGRWGDGERGRWGDGEMGRGGEGFPVFAQIVSPSPPLPLCLNDKSLPGHDMKPARGI
ncbi:hypothetical protein [Scytonema sp. NUACC21]